MPKSTSTFGENILNPNKIVEVSAADNFTKNKSDRTKGDFNITLHDVYGNSISSEFCSDLKILVERLKGDFQKIPFDPNLYSVRVHPFNNSTANAVCTVSNAIQKFGEYLLTVSHGEETVATQKLRVVHNYYDPPSKKYTNIKFVGSYFSERRRKPFLQFRISLRDRFNNPLSFTHFRYLTFWSKEKCDFATTYRRSLYINNDVIEVAEGEYEATHFVHHLYRECALQELDMMFIDHDMVEFKSIENFTINGLWKHTKTRNYGR